MKCIVSFFKQPEQKARYVELRDKSKIQTNDLGIPRKVKKQIASKNRNNLKCFEAYNYFFKQYLQQILQQLSSINVQNHFFRHYSRELIKKRPFSIIS